MRRQDCHSATADGLMTVGGGFRSTFDVTSGGKQVIVKPPN